MSVALHVTVELYLPKISILKSKPSGPQSVTFKEVIRLKVSSNPVMIGVILRRGNLDRADHGGKTM